MAGAGRAPAPIGPPVAAPPDREYSEEPYRPDRVRGMLGFALLGVLALTVAFVAAQVARGYWEQTREFAEIIVPAEIALLGSAVGFYFTAPPAP